MSRNSDYAKKLTKLFSKLPTEAVKAASKAAYVSILENTVQDSGQAAYNWHAQINTTRQYPYQYVYGVGPVGYKGDKRSSGFDRSIVIDDRAKVGPAKDVRFVFIYNPMWDPDHAANAQLAMAIGLSTGRDWLDNVAEMRVNAYLQQRS